MSANHGNTPAGWTACAVAMVGFVVAGIALMVQPVSVTWFWIGAVLCVAALPLYLIMNKMGMGEAQH